MIVIFFITQILLFALSIIFPSAAVPIRLTISFSFLVFVLIKILWQKPVGYYKFLLLGLIACFTGDMFLGDVIPISASFLAGIASFGVAQILFICVFIKILRTNRIKVFNRRLVISMSVLLIIYCVLCIIFMKFSETSNVIKIGVVAYTFLLCTMAAFAISLTSINKRYWITTIGAILFVISDIIIGITGFDIFYIPAREFAIWSTYVTALMGIVYGISINSTVENNASWQANIAYVTKK